MAADDLTPAYPATEIALDEPASSDTPRAGRKRNPLAKLWATRNGRIMLAVMLAALIAAVIYLRSRIGGAAAPADPLAGQPTTAQALPDATAGLSQDVVAPAIPAGGFDFQNLDDGTIGGSTVHIVVDLNPPANTTGGTTTQANPTTATPKARGYYRASSTAGWRHEDGKGHASAWKPSPAQNKAIAAACKRAQGARPVTGSIQGVKTDYFHSGKVQPHAYTLAHAVAR